MKYQLSRDYILDVMCHGDRAAYRNFVKEVREANEVLADHVAAYPTPRLTVRHCVGDIGYSMTLTIVASLVLSTEWDGRISERNAQWARTVTTIDPDTLQSMWIFLNIHPCHLDQVADYLRSTPAEDIERDVQDYYPEVVCYA